MQTLEEFIDEWNATHSYFKFVLDGVSMLRLNVKICCSTTIYQKFLTIENWSRLSCVIEGTDPWKHVSIGLRARLLRTWLYVRGN